MDHAFYDKLKDFASIYPDNILVFGHSIEEHTAHFPWDFNQLQKYSLKAKMKKKNIVLVLKDRNS